MMSAKYSTKSLAEEERRKYMKELAELDGDQRDQLESFVRDVARTYVSTWHTTTIPS
jgi:hypothetical protein